MYATPDRAVTREYTVDEFLNELGDEDAWPSVPCETQNEKLNKPGFTFVQYRAGATSKAASFIDPGSETEIFCFDVDDITAEEFGKIVLGWTDYNVCIYSTWRSTDEKPRLRVLVGLSEPVSNYQKEPYQTLYLAAAQKLGIKVDYDSIDRAHSFRGPQHKPGNTARLVRLRFPGRDLNVREFSAESISAELGRGKGEENETQLKITKEKPKKQDFLRFITSLRKSSSSHLQQIATALGSIIAGEAFAVAGGVHNVMVPLTYQLMSAFPNLDYEWFAHEYVEKSWARMPYETATSEARLKAWTQACEGALKKHDMKNRIRDKVIVERPGSAPDEIVSEAERARGRLVVSYRNVYFVFDPKSVAYLGPFTASEVPIVVRDCLGGVPGIVEFKPGKARILKTATELAHEYGCVCSGVTYFPQRPNNPWDASTQSINVQAYRWILWNPVFHPIVDELLTAVAGKHKSLLLMYLSKFRDLTQPLPALTLIGTRGTWKSRICQHLSRFWTSRDGASPGDASKIMTRFNSHLLHNPVIWSEEKLACSWRGTPQPEEYRQSITALTHSVEPKRLEIVTLMSAVRHVISVNNDEQIFSSEVDADSIYATMERFLLFYTDAEAVERFEAKWYGTPELERLREGASLLEHVMWVEQNLNFESEGRLFVRTHTEARILMKARFADELLNYIWQVCFEALENEASYTTQHKLQRLPLVCDQEGRLRLKPARICDLWVSSRVVAGVSVRKPSTQRINNVLSKAGFKKTRGERAMAHAMGGWEVNHETLREFIGVADVISISEFSRLVEVNCGRKPLGFGDENSE